MLLHALEFENEKDAHPLLNRYNRDEDEWDVSRDSTFWKAVREAHRLGNDGSGKRIAIIDSAFDLSIPRLRFENNVRRRLQTSPNENHAHGTAVALLAATVAPKASLDLYEVAEKGTPSSLKVKNALSLCGESSANVVNLSLGRQPARVPSIWHILTGHRGHCGLCRAAANTVATGKLVVAAVGNKKGLAFCPARECTVVGVGFQTEQLMFIDSGEAAIAGAGPPKYAQATIPDYAIRQPEGVLGSSFASPLIAAALTLLENPNDVWHYLASVRKTAIAFALHGMLKQKQSPAPTDVEEVKKGYEVALGQLPHRHDGTEHDVPCFSCALFADGLYTNAGLFFCECDRFDIGEALLRAARRFAPWSEHAAANLAAALRGRATIVQGGERHDRLSLLREADEHYQYALSLRPGFKPYQVGLEQVRKLLSQVT